MPSITFVQTDNTEVVVNASLGDSLMEAAKAADVEGILAECGGACACATCHVYISEEQQAQLPEATQFEKDVAEGALNANEQSRLSCQITVSEAMDGMRIVVPEGLY